MDIKDTQEQQSISYKVNYKSSQKGKDTHSGPMLRAMKLQNLILVKFIFSTLVFKFRK